MKSVPIPPPTDKVDRISEKSMSTIKVEIDSLTNNNQKHDLNEVIKVF